MILLYLFLGMIIAGIDLKIHPPTKEQKETGCMGEIFLMILFWPMIAGSLLVTK